MEVLEAFFKVKSNKGAAGIDDQTIEDFERNLKGNLYKVWDDIGQLLSSARADSDDTESQGRGKGVRYSHGQCELHLTAVRIWDGRRYVIRSIHFEDSASKYSSGDV